MAEHNEDLPTDLDRFARSDRDAVWRGARVALAGESPQQSPLRDVLGPISELFGAFHAWIDRHRDEVKAVLDWVAQHQQELEALSVWGAAQRACRTTCLYAPLAPAAWSHLAEAERRGENPETLAALILKAYGPGGDAHDALQAELRSAPLLQNRRRELDEVLDSLVDARHYVTICGALPLVEGVLAGAYGNWQRHPSGYPSRSGWTRVGR